MTFSYTVRPMMGKRSTTDQNRPNLQLSEDFSWHPSQPRAIETRSPNHINHSSLPLNAVRNIASLLILKLVVRTDYVACASTPWQYYRIHRPGLRRLESFYPLLRHHYRRPGSKGHGIQCARRVCCVRFMEYRRTFSELSCMPLSSSATDPVQKL